MQYDSSAPYRGLLELAAPDFSNASLCSVRTRGGYCALSAATSATSLATTMHLMALASSPLHHDATTRRHIQGKLRSFTPSNNSMPNLSYIPTCFFGKDASNFWSLRDYGKIDHDNDISPELYQQMATETRNLRPGDLYRQTCKRCLTMYGMESIKYFEKFHQKQLTLSLSPYLKS